MVFCCIYRGNIQELPGGYDGWWPTRGDGRNYNSKVGGGALTSAESGKVYAYEFKHKRCRKCDYWLKRNKKPPPHTCKMDWSGSSKAMEAAIAEDLCKKVQKQGVKINPIIMDNDTTTPARLRQNLDYNIEKWDDSGHSSKGLTSKMYELAKVHKELRLEGHCAVKTIAAHYNYAVAQCKGKPLDLANRLGQIVPHCFDNHDKCGSWCHALEDPLYKPKGLPKRQYLQDPQLRKSLTSLFEQQIANVDSIAPAASTRVNESLHCSVASKAPKVRDYSGSEVYDGRASCAISQRNIGYHYVPLVNKSMSNSPGEIAKIVAERKNRKRKQQFEMTNTREFKIRRKMRKMKQKQKEESSKVKEGVTYESQVSAPGCEDHNVEEIPDPIVIEPKQVSPTNVAKVLFDVETTGFSNTDQIIQIAALHGNDKFAVYVTPTKKISKFAAKVTGLVTVGGTLMRKGKDDSLEPLSSIQLSEALTQFMDFLQSTCKGKKCLLVAHNAPFDQRHVMNALLADSDANKVTRFGDLVLGFADTLEIYKKMFPELKPKSGGSGHTQESLVKHVLSKSYNAHDALADVETLQDLIKQTKLSDAQLFENSKSTKHYIQDKVDLQQNEDKNLPSLMSLVKCTPRVLTLPMAKKVARSGLNYSHVELAITRGPDKYEAIKALFGDETSGTVRVTKKADVIRAVVDHFENALK